MANSMHNDKIASFFEKIDIPPLLLEAKGTDPVTLKKIIEHLDNIVTNRSVPLFIFFNPDLEKYSEALEIPVKDVFSSFHLLASFLPNYFKMRVVLDRDGLFYVVQEEDLLEIQQYDSPSQ